MAKVAANPLHVPPFSPGFFARGQMPSLHNIFAARDLRSNTTDIENCGPVVLLGDGQLTMSALHGTHGTQITPMANGETDLRLLVSILSGRSAQGQFSLGAQVTQLAFLRGVQLGRV